MNLRTYDYAVVGAGIIGAAAAVRLSELQPKAQILLIDKEDSPARHQSGRNSGVVHTGAYYRPGSKKAVCVGRPRLVACMPMVKALFKIMQRLPGGTV